MAFLRAITNKTLVSKTKNKKLITCPAHKRARCNFFTLCFGRIRSRVTHSHTHTHGHTHKNTFNFSSFPIAPLVFLFLQYFLYLFYVLEPPWSRPNNGAFVYSVTYRDTLNGYGCECWCYCWCGSVSVCFLLYSCVCISERRHCVCLQLIIEILNYAWRVTVVVVAVVVCAKQMLISSQYQLKTKLSKFVFASQHQKGNNNIYN